jgi:hypothetical protein
MAMNQNAEGGQSGAMIHLKIITAKEEEAIGD